MHLALYKAPGTFYDKLVRVATASRYSHCELVIDGICYSSSPRDGGVRSKRIQLGRDAWEMIPVYGNSCLAMEWFAQHEGAAYDLFGAIRTVVPFSWNSASRWFCSEACAAMLQLENPGTYTPASLAQRLSNG